MKDINLTPVFEAIIALLAAIITYKLVPWIRGKATEQQISNLSAAAKIAVYAAEQIYKSGGGEEKLQYAVEQLRSKGFNLDTEALRSAVEQAVYEMNTEKSITESYLSRDKKAGENDLEEEDDLTDFRLPAIEDWPLEMIVDFFNDNGIPHEGCHTKEDYIKILYDASEPPDEEQPAE